MHSTTLRTSIAVGAMLLFPALLRAAVTDPIVDFKAGMAIKPDDKILKWEVDLNGDGKSEILLSLKSEQLKAAGQNEGPAWQVYIAQSDGGYVLAKGIEVAPDTLSVAEVPEINPGACFVGQITQFGKRGMVTMQIASPREGESVATLCALTVEGDHLKRVELAKYPMGQQNAVFDQYLKQGVRTAVHLEEVAP